MAWQKTLWLPLVENSWIYKFPYYCSIHVLYLYIRRQVLSSSARCRYFAIAERSPRFLNREHVKLLNWPNRLHVPALWPLHWQDASHFRSARLIWGGM